MNICIDCGKKCSGKRCKKCFIDSIGKKFEFGEWKFNTAKELNTTIKYLLQECPYNIEFENKFFSCLINKYHKGMNKHNLQVTKFKILDYNNQIGEWKFAQERYRGGILILGFFTPINKWHGVTVYPHKEKTERQRLVNALRQKLNETLKARNPDAKCEICGVSNPQLHHNNITFKQIFEESVKNFSREEIDNGLNLNWWEHENEADALQDNHPAVLTMLKLHEIVEYKWLCYEHHKIKQHKREI